MILGIDSSTKAIHCVGLRKNGKLVGKWAVRSKSPDTLKRYNELMNDFRDLLNDLIDKYEDLKVYVEDVIYIQNPITTINLAKIVSMIQVICTELGIEYNIVMNRTWKKEVVGNGAAKKEDIKKFAIRQFGLEDGLDQDFYDASCLSLYGIRHESKSNMEK